MKKWLFPLGSAVISAAALFLIGVIGVWGNGDGTGYGGAVAILCGIVCYCALIIPATCTVYARRCLSGAKLRVLFTLYQSVLMSWPFLLLFFMDPKAFFYGAIIFVWCELWSLIGLIPRKSKRRVSI